MATATGQERSVERSGRWQVNLADLIFLVLGTALVAWLARGAHDLLPKTAPPGSMKIGLDSARTAGLASEIAAVWLAMILMRGAIALLTGRRSGTDSEQRPILAFVAWRIVAIALLLWLAIRESWFLRVDFQASNVRWTVELGKHEWQQLRDTLIPVCSILVLIGIALGMGAGGALARPGPRRPRPYWLFVPLGVIAAVLFTVRSDGLWAIAHLVVVAIEAVNNAMKPAYRLTSAGLSERILRAGVATVPAMLTCLWLALLVARDFERARRVERWATSRSGWILRILSLVAVLASGFVVTFVAIPTLHPHLFDGFRKTLEPEILAIILAGFASFAAGLASRTLVPLPTGERPRWLRRLSAAVPFALIAIILFSAWRSLPASMQLDPAVAAIVGRLCDSATAANLWLVSVVPEAVAPAVAAWLEPERLAWTVAMIVVASFALELTFTRFVAGAMAPFDAVAESPGRLVRFLWLTAALSAVCLVALPTLIVLGQILIHIRLSIDNWTAHGWPSPF